jgi:predicted regulator of Ras-like GTPase activity (Roadblock/LC7/MglB family)
MTFNASPEANDELDRMLAEFDKSPGVIGTTIVDFDGVVLATTLSTEKEAELVGTWALAVFMNSKYVVKKLRLEDTHWILSKTTQVFALIFDWGNGLVAVLINGDEKSGLPQLAGLDGLIST